MQSLARLLEGQHRDLRRRILTLLSERRFAASPGLPREEYRELVLKWCRALAREGLGGLGYPAEFGGQGDPAAGIVAFQTIAFHDLSLVVKFGVQFGLFGGAIANLGTERHHVRYLPKVASLALPGCFAMTETGHGSNVRDIRTTARYDPKSRGFVVHTPNAEDRKDYIGNAALHGRTAVVFAQLEVDGERHGVHALVVPIRDARGNPRPGVRIEDCGDKLGLNGVDNGRIRFDHVRVPRTALLNRFGDVGPDGTYSSPIPDPSKRFFTMLGTLVQGRVSIAAASVSASQSALAIAVRYGLRRRQFGPPGGEEVLLLDYRTHQRRLLPAVAATYAMHFGVEQLIADYARAQTASKDQGKARRQLEGFAAGLKAAATWHATETIQMCREACGGQGYLAVNRLAALKADTEVFTTFEGDNTVLMLLLARSLLTDYRVQFEDMDWVKTSRYLAGRVLSSLQEATPAGAFLDVLFQAVPGRGEGTDVRRREVHLEAFRFREQHLLAGLGRRIKRVLDEGVGSYEAFERHGDHAVAAARAHVDLMLLERFSQVAERARGERLKDTLGTLCDLFALSRIERDRGWFQEHGFLSGGRSKEVVKAVGELCAELRPKAGDLVAAFGIPDAVLAAPITVQG